MSENRDNSLNHVKNCHRTSEVCENIERTIKGGSKNSKELLNRRVIVTKIQNSTNNQETEKGAMDEKDRNCDKSNTRCMNIIENRDRKRQEDREQISNMIEVGCVDCDKLLYHYWCANVDCETRGGSLIQERMVTKRIEKGESDYSLNTRCIRKTVSPLKEGTCTKERLVKIEEGVVKRESEKYFNRVDYSNANGNSQWEQIITPAGVTSVR